jgi:hypothetical protein
MKKYYQNKTFEPTRSPSRLQSEISLKTTDYPLKKTSTCYPKVTKFPKPDPPEPFAFSSYELSNISPPTHPKFKLKSHSNVAFLMAQKLKIKRLNLSQPNPQKSKRVHLLSAYTPQTHINNPFSLLNLNKSTHQFFGSNGKGVTGMVEVLGDVEKAPCEGDVNRVAGVLEGRIGPGLSFGKSRAWGKDIVGGSGEGVIKGERGKGVDGLGRVKSLLDGYDMDVMGDEVFEGFGTTGMNNVGSTWGSHFYGEEEG